MPQTSQKNSPLSAAGADLGLQSDVPGLNDETEEERKKRLALLQQQQMAGAGRLTSMAGQMLGLQ